MSFQISGFMRSQFWSILLSAWLMLGTATPVYAQDGQIVHIVQPGETLYRIALSYGVPMDQIATANGIVDPGLIYVGQSLIIPFAVKSATATSPTIVSNNPGRIHIVKAGETLVSISGLYGVSPQVIASANSLYDRDLIYVGQHLTIPEVAEISLTSAPTQHDVRLSVPLYGQLHSLSCEASAARMMAAYYGVAQEEWWFQNALGVSDNPHFGFRGNVDGVFGWIDDYGTYAEPVARVLQSTGVSTTVRYGMTYDELRATLDQGAPIIVWTSPRTDVHDMPEGYRLIPEEHTFIVVGYDSAGFLVNDPLYGGRLLKITTIPGWELFNNMAVAGPSVGPKK